MKMTIHFRGLLGIAAVIAACYTASLLAAEPSIEERLLRVREAIRCNELNWKAEITDAAKRDPDIPVAAAEPSAYAGDTENVAVKIASLEDLPESFDWRNDRGRDWTTEARNQGSCGACWAFVAVGIVEAQLNIFADNPDLDLNLSEQELVSYAGDSGCSGGNQMDALDYIRGTGIVDEGCLPYRADAQPYPFCDDAAARRQRIAEVLLLEGSQQMTPGEIKTTLVTRGPVGIMIGAKVQDDFKFYTGGIYEPTETEPSLGAHLVLLVGYDNEDGCWIIKNSWGRAWGEDGFGRLRYGVCDVEQNAYLAGADVSSLNLKDSDGDGFYDTATGGDDTDDSNPEIHPGGEYQVFYKDVMTDSEWRTIGEPIRAISEKIGVLDVSAGNMRFYRVLTTNPLMRDEDGDGLPDSWQAVRDLRPIVYEQEVGLVWTAVPPSIPLTDDAHKP